MLSWMDDRRRRLLNPTEQLIPVVGAGVSIDAGLPGGADLAEWIAEQFPLDSPVTPASLFAVVDAVDHDATDPLDLRRRIAEHIAAIDIVPTPLALELVRIPSRIIVTFNYDLHLEAAAATACVPFVSFGRRDLQDVHKVLVDADPSPESLVIAHPHGSVDDPDSIVLDSRGYTTLCRDQDMRDIVYELAHRWTMVFLGTALDEPYLLADLQGQRNARTHLLLGHNDEREALTQARAGLSAARHHIEVVTYQHHDDILDLTAELLEAPVPVDEQPTAPVESPEVTFYVPNEFSDRSQPIDEADDFRASLGLERAAPAPPAVTEGDIASGHRTLLVGAPGSGKSEVLRHAAKQAPVGQPALVIRLADVDIRAGAAAMTLAAWARKASSATTNVSISADALARRSYHFMLDGLDEVAIDRQATAAKLIVGIASEFPQHAFTVSSRPVDALVAFSALANGDGKTEGWRVIDVRPTRVWQKRYLNARRVSFGELEVVMPALSDLRELLELPFFLKATVDLHEAGRLAGLPDLWALLRELVDLSLEREAHQLLLPNQDVRQWLRDVALALVLAGRRVIRLEELDQFALREPVIGGVSALASLLVQRLLLTDRPGGYAFFHRILGESLAAEALEQLAPDSRLLDAVAPQRSAALSGVREDCTVTLALLCSRSDDWRRAIAERDPLAAARATPPAAPHAERAAAAERLWQHYAQLGVWMWDYDVPDLVEASEALGRLLRGDGMTTQVAIVRDALHGGSVEGQGNAVRVLSRVNPVDFANDLRRILEDPAREGVVRRQAAIAARDLRLTELLPQIIACAVNTHDDSQAQDCTSAAVDLAADEELFEVGMALMAGKYGGVLAADTIGRRLGAAARIAFARELSACGNADRTERRLLLDAVEDIDETLDPQAIHDAAYAAARWEADSEELRQLLAENRAAALEGFSQALADGTDWWQVAPFTGVYTPDELQAAGLPEALVNNRRVAEQAHHPQAATPRRTQATRVAPAADAADPAASRPPSRLVNLLTEPPERSDAELQANAFELSRQVRVLIDAERDELRRRLETWWPTEPLADTIQRDEAQRWIIEHGTTGWLWYGPAIDAPLDTPRWAEVATCGVLFEDQRQWLRRHCTPNAVVAAAEMLDTQDADRWADLTSCCDGPLPARVIELLAARAERVGRAESTLGPLALHLLESDAESAARELAKRIPAFAVALRPVLAARGDSQAQAMLLEALTAGLRRGEFPADGDELAWMHATSDDALLPQLFDLLRAAYPLTADRPVPKFSLSRIINRSIEAIKTIGGSRAVEGYDQLLSENDVFRWLHRQRDAVAQSVLRLDGAEAAEAAAATAGVPALAVGAAGGDDV